MKENFDIKETVKGVVNIINEALETNEENSQSLNWEYKSFFYEDFEAYRDYNGAVHVTCHTGEWGYTYEDLLEEKTVDFSLTPHDVDNFIKGSKYSTKYIIFIAEYVKDCIAYNERVKGTGVKFVDLKPETKSGTILHIEGDNAIYMKDFQSIVKIA